MIELVGISYSPWSEAARWALDHHRVPYRQRTYLSMVGEPALRWRTRNFTGKVSVPVAFDGEVVLTDSWDIARHAEAVGQGAPLFPAGREDEVARWNALSQKALAAGRLQATARVTGDIDAGREMVPPPLRGLPGALQDGVVRLGTAYLLRKYPLPDADLAAVQREALLSLREGLGGGEHLLGDFSYADVVMALVLQFVAPVEDRWIRIGRASRRTWGDPALAEEFADLVAWRDRTFTRHRTPA